MNDLLDRAGRGEDIGNLQFVIQRADHKEQEQDQ
jgi:hypothetical protein